VSALKTFIEIAWAVFWIYWFASAAGVKEGTAGRRRVPLIGGTALSIVLIVRVLRVDSLAVHSIVLGVIGTALFLAGLATAVWARVNLGRNWGMPMTQKSDPELVTSGPYRFVRHPIYSGLLLAVLGTALVVNLVGLIIGLVLGSYFYYSATVEERNLTEVFPADYPEYRSHTKMLIPFVL
jgi:protein-S-isoprenylcysteine O-methyltransferase Ste14